MIVKFPINTGSFITPDTFAPGTVYSESSNVSAISTYPVVIVISFLEVFQIYALADPIDNMNATRSNPMTNVLCFTIITQP